MKADYIFRNAAIYTCDKKNPGLKRYRFMMERTCLATIVDGEEVYRSV